MFEQESNFLGKIESENVSLSVCEPTIICSIKDPTLVSEL